jgi:V8-like Glu-specific endopeptidase/energy-coupling factor transporter ATP-binding protein EcfA2
MNTDFKVGVVRIIDAGGKTVGTGFVVTSDGLIVTCAHVIDIARSDDSVQLLFYNSSSTKEMHEVRVARVEPDYWRDAAAEDVSYLRLEGPLPKGVVPLPLGSSFNTQGQTFRSFGFPEARPDDGMLGECRIIGFVSEESISLLQLSSNQVTKGFSGAPVWDDSRHVVIGMVTSIVATRRIKIASTELLIPFDSGWRQTETAFATPVETLFKIYPPLQPTEVCPYRGLDVFSEDHAEFFFGREHIIDRLVNRLKQDVRFLAVLGPSGSGKSSLVQAGLIPRLRQGAIPGSDHWELIVTRPANDPFNQLAAKGLEVESQNLTASVQAWLAQHSGRTRLRLVLDQFEELLTACPEALRQAFVSQLTSLLGASLPITIILIMRGDFYEQLVRQETLVEWLEQSQGPVNVPQTLRRAELIAIVQKPAEAVRLRFEDGLIEIIVKDTMEAAALSSDEGVVTRSSNLPLLEFALTQLWERRESGMLLRNVYTTIGGGNWGIDAVG